MAIQTRMARSGVAAPVGRPAEVGDGGVAVGTVALGDVVDLGTALLVVIAGVDALTVLVAVLIDVAVTDGDADPLVGAFPQPARTSPTDVKADSSTVRVVQGLLDDSVPMSTQ